jgi:uncharacterized protein (DUF427 family)
LVGADSDYGEHNQNLMRMPTPIKPGIGQESVWDYPRPPRLEQSPKRLQVVFNGALVADSDSAWRVLETSHPPVYYIPPDHINLKYLNAINGSSWCEWKGQASYYDVVVNKKVARQAAWSYAQPAAAFSNIKNHIAFYAWAMDACLVDGEKARPQPGKFYGGWITDDVVGPFKGGPGSRGW